MTQTLFTFDTGMKVELAERAVHPLDLVIPLNFLRGERNDEDVLSLTINEALELSVALHAAAIKAEGIRENLGKE